MNNNTHYNNSSKKVNFGKTNRKKGFDAERLYASKFREELGFTYCKTTRESSRLLDSCKIDLDFIPFGIQIKAGKQRNLNYSKSLYEIDEKVKVSLPDNNPFKNCPKLVIHYKQGTSGRKRTEYDELVIMSFETFKKLIHGNTNWYEGAVARV